jgi:hypothetical protein
MQDINYNFYILMTIKGLQFKYLVYITIVRVK